MKSTSTLLIVTILTIAASAVHAQISKGVNALGGNLSFNTGTSKSSTGLKQTGTNFSISPSFMTAYENNRAVGFNVNYGYSKNSFGYQKTNTYGAGIFLRQYKSLGKGFYIFAQEALAFDYSKNTTEFSDSLNVPNNKQLYIGVSVNPVLAYDVSKHFQLELLFFNNLIGASYTYGTNTSISSTIKTDNFSLGANLDASQLTSLNIGAKIFFDR
ncbi:MAG: hypothetical protein ABJA35_09075 [Parafilimonas sp.]